jgi:hypothetical protein
MGPKRKYNVIFRACDIVNAVNKNPRPFNLEKALLIKLCFLSLVESLKDLDFKIIVLGDKLSEDMIAFFNSFEIELHLGNFGNDASIRETLKIASTIPDDEWIYFCEDDYLHAPNAFRIIDHFLNERDSLFNQKKKLDNLSTLVNLKNKDLFIFPPDYPDRYKSRYLKHSLILVSSDCHWRQVTNTTLTFLSKSSAIKKHFSLFRKSSVKAGEGTLGNADRLLSRKLFGRFGFGFWTSSVCFSPVPGLSTHMHRDTMTPLVNWEKLVVEYGAKVEALDY